MNKETEMMIIPIIKPIRIHVGNSGIVGEGLGARKKPSFYSSAKKTYCLEEHTLNGDVSRKIFLFLAQ